MLFFKQPFIAMMIASYNDIRGVVIMARKTFISYKYSEAQKLRDDIIKALGKDATYYKGETSDSPDLTDTSTENIKKNLADMIYNTSVTILIISKNMKKSKWIPWEISYCLKEINRDGRVSKSNGIVGVIKEEDNSYDWFLEEEENEYHDGICVSYNESKVPDIVRKNRYNSNPIIYHCGKCKKYDSNYGSYISYVKEKEFLKNPNKYIEIAYEKSNDIDKYKIVKQLD